MAAFFAALTDDDRAFIARQPVFFVAIDQVQTSCGWGVPEMTLTRERETLVKYARNFGADALLDVMTSRDRSIDGLPVRVPTQVPAR